MNLKSIFSGRKAILLAAGLWLFVVLALVGISAWAQGVLPVPALTGHVIDTTATLTPAQQSALEAKLAAFEQARGAQVVLLLVPTTQPEDIAAYAQRIGNSWKIGRKNIGDGLLVVVAKNDRAVWIETTKTLEGAIPDLAARQIVDTAITPRFKQGDFAGGLDAATDQIMARITGEKLPAPAQGGTASSRGGNGNGNGSGGFDWTTLGVFLFFAVPLGGRVLSSVLGRKLGAFATGGAVGGLAWLFTSSLLIGGIAAVAGIVFALIAGLGSLGGRSSGWGGGLGGGGFGGGGFGGGGFGSGGGSSSGGGFSSGGGGDFGGGGAGGNW